MLSLLPDVRLVLGSASPRRSELLSQLGINFEVRPADIDEAVQAGETPTAYVARLSREKAGAVGRAGELVVAADTTVVVEGEILAKPDDQDDARRMLTLLSGRTHVVHTGVTVLRVGARSETQVVDTAVTFIDLDALSIAWYLATGEPSGKAGGYAIQGAGAALVERINGSVTNVIGLPLAETVAMIRDVSDAEA